MSRCLKFSGWIAEEDFTDAPPSDILDCPICGERWTRCRCEPSDCLKFDALSTVASWRRQISLENWWNLS